MRYFPLIIGIVTFVLIIVSVFALYQANTHEIVYSDNKQSPHTPSPTSITPTTTHPDERRAPENSSPLTIHPQSLTISPTPLAVGGMPETAPRPKQPLPFNARSSEKSIILEKGDTLLIEDTRFQLAHTITIPTGATLMIRNAILEFETGGRIAVHGGALLLRDTVIQTQCETEYAIELTNSGSMSAIGIRGGPCPNQFTLFHTSSAIITDSTLSGRICDNARLTIQQATMNELVVCDRETRDAETLPHNIEQTTFTAIDSYYTWHISILQSHINQWRIYSK